MITVTQSTEEQINAALISLNKDIEKLRSKITELEKKIETLENN